MKYIWLFLLYSDALEHEPDLMTSESHLRRRIHRINRRLGINHLIWDESKQVEFSNLPSLPSIPEELFSLLLITILVLRFETYFNLTGFFVEPRTLLSKETHWKNENKIYLKIFEFHVGFPLFGFPMFG